jgi:N-acetylneuraminate synthase/N,N'-diacetyllegionaminate synthase
MRIGPIDLTQRVLVVAEIGNNHEGDVDRARRMVEAAAVAGVDAVKFQTIIPERLASSDQRERLAQLRRFQLSPADHEMLATAAADAGVLFLSTPFAIEAVDWLERLVPAFKIASGDNDFWPLIDRVARTGKPLMISLGLGGERRAAALVEYCREAWRRHGVATGELALLHCVSAYPTPDDGAGLSAIHRLRDLGVTVGYSDHTLGLKAAELAVAAGARIVEKHFTLDKQQSAFRDHQLSADPADMRDLVSAIRQAERMLQRADHADAGNRTAASRSIAAARDLAAGTIVQWQDLTWLRPGSGLRPGSEERVVGRRVLTAVAAGQLVLPEHLG